MKKIIILMLVLTLSLTISGCEKKEEVLEEERVTMTDDYGEEYEFAVTVAQHVGEAFSILDNFSWEELGLLADKERYIWGPETDPIDIEYNGETITTIMIHAGVETVNGFSSVGNFHVDYEGKRIFIWDNSKNDFRVLEVKEQ